MSRAERARPEKVRSDPDLQKNICRNADVVTPILECCSVMTPEIKMKRALLGENWESMARCARSLSLFTVSGSSAFF